MRTSFLLLAILTLFSSKVFADDRIKCKIRYADESKTIVIHDGDEGDEWIQDLHFSYRLKRDEGTLKLKIRTLDHNGPKLSSTLKINSEYISVVSLQLSGKSATFMCNTEKK